jgi:mono/diheme cytochrome c family protein
MLSKAAAAATTVALILGLVLTQEGPANADDGTQLYNENCAACHGPKGHGDGPAAAGLTPKPADFSTVLPGKTDDWLNKVISGGGQAIGQAPVMPAFDGAFNAEQMNALVAYLKQLASGTN